MIGEVDEDTYGTSVEDVRSAVASFLEYLRSAGMVKLYSSYTGIGRQNVRLDAINDEAKWKNEGGEQWLIWKVNFKVNDPITNMVYDEDNDKIIEEATT